MSQIRGFANTDLHDEAVLDSYRKALRQGDDLWILGDLTAGGKASEERALDLLLDLKHEKSVRLHLVSGNHDSVSGVHRDGFKRQRRFMLTFDSVQDFARKRGPGRVPVFLSHYPFDLSKTYVAPGPEWRETDAPGYYANAEGEIRGRSGKILKPSLSGSGYFHVSTSGGTSKQTKRTVHTLVCSAFHGPRPEGMEVAHNNGDPLNNRASNLRWATRPENIEDRYEHGGGSAGEDSGNAKLTWADVTFIRESDLSLAVLAEQFGVGRTAIWNVKHEVIWRTDTSDLDLGDGPGRGSARYAEYRLPDMGHWLIHGHTHQPERLAGPRSIHVGWDAWRRPVAWNEIEQIIEKEAA